MPSRVWSVLALASISCAAPAAPPPRVASPPAPAAPAPPVAVAAPPAQVFAAADPGFAFADPDRRAKLAAAFPAVDREVTAELARQSLPGVAIGIVIDGELAYERGFGVVDLESRAAPGADTIYRIGSITKSFIGLAVLAQRDAGTLGLDDPLARWIPEASGLVYPSRDSRPIVLRQILSHTSGLPRLGTFDVDTGPSEETIVKSLAGLPLTYAPGTDWRYSNLGFSLLGLVVGRAAGAPFEDVIAKQLFAPLGMTSTYWRPDAVPAARFAPAYRSTPGGPVRAEPARRGAAGGSGAIFSTVRDMARYVALQLSAYPPRDAAEAGPIRRATLREAHATGFQASSWARLEPLAKPGEHAVAYNASTYGFGWIRDQTCDFDDLVWHNGSIDSHRAMSAFLPSRGVGVIALTNFEVGNPDRIGRLVLAELLRTGALVPRIPRPSPALLAAVPRLIAVINQWDTTAYRAMLDPGRTPMADVEQAELATYHRLHGRCTTATPITIVSPTAARFRIACERGAFELEIGVSAASGLLAGFVGISRDIAAPPELQRQADALASLVGRWDDALHQRLLAKTKRSRADARTYFAELRAAYGACRVRGAVHQGFDWRMELACDRGGAPELLLQLRDGKPDALEGYRIELSTRGCPRR